MQTVRTTTNSLTLLNQASGLFILHFGFYKIEDEDAYYCYERSYRAQPTLDLVNAYIDTVDTKYRITEDEWAENTGRVENE